MRNISRALDPLARDLDALEPRTPEQWAMLAASWQADPWWRQLPVLGS